jgi:hypothetical protein
MIEIMNRTRNTAFIHSTSSDNYKSCIGKAISPVVTLPELSLIELATKLMRGHIISMSLKRI